ncbi:uncharacterized protein HKW66_Vig0042820 [Vigna angularis]|uniref:Uncharacterized protein n=1 Tax=Phaseolus angularis TaxID=3914 RepID=A0A8T0KYI8_PHAAN|nr:uncharacterized protein HKW66_Vig0042820 [Vigna angularis]
MERRRFARLQGRSPLANMRGFATIYDRKSDVPLRQIIIPVLPTTTEVETPSTSFLSFLNGIGIFSSRVLGALYTPSQKEKAAADATIETPHSHVSPLAIHCFLPKFKVVEVISLKGVETRQARL